MPDSRASMPEPRRPLSLAAALLSLLAACSAQRAPEPKAATTRVPVAQPKPAPAALAAPPRSPLSHTSRPAAQAGPLAVSPSRRRFRGRAGIDGTLRPAPDVVWVHAGGPGIRGGSAKVGPEEPKAGPVVRGRPRVGL